MKIIFHLGIHKTASTFWQKSIFTNLKNCLFLDRYKSREFKRYILYTDDFEFDSKIAYDLFTKITNENIRQEQDTIIISDEEYYGNPYLGAVDRKRNIDRILKTFEKNVYFLIFLRNQTSLIESIYNQYIKTGGTATFNSFISYQKYPLITQSNYFKYNEYLKYLIQNVSKNNVSVHLFEEFKNNKPHVIEKICNNLNLYLEIKTENEKIVNFSLSNTFLGPMRIFNKITKSPKEPFLLLPSSVHYLVRRVFLYLSNYFRNKSTRKKSDEYEFFVNGIKESNQELLQLIPSLDITGYNYPL